MLIGPCRVPTIPQTRGVERSQQFNVCDDKAAESFVGGAETDNQKWCRKICRELRPHADGKKPHVLMPAKSLTVSVLNASAKVPCETCLCSATGERVHGSSFCWLHDSEKRLKTAQRLDA